MRRIGPLVLTLGWLGYLWWGHVRDVTPWVGLASGIAVAGALAAAVIPTTAVRAPTAIAALLLASLGGFALLRVVGRWPFVWDALADRRYAALIAGLAIAIALGLARGALWARWTAIAFSAGSMLGGTLNSIGMRGLRDETAWLAAIGVFGGATIWTLLARPAVGEHFARGAQHAVWASRDRLVRSARWAAIANFAAAPMLILYAFGQPLARQTVTTALVLAPVLGLGSVLVVRRRAAGIAILAAGALGLIAQTAATLDLASDRFVAGYYAAFWLPAAALGLTAGILALVRVRTRALSSA